MYVCAGMANQVLSYVGDQLILNYTNGETCHKIYKRTTQIYFSCHPDRHPVSFTQSRCSYTFFFLLLKKTYGHIFIALS